MYYLNARYYDPETGRFINADDNLSDLNLYRYCHNNPINRADHAGCDDELEKILDIKYPGKPTITLVTRVPNRNNLDVTAVLDADDAGHAFLVARDGAGYVEYSGFFPDDNMNWLQKLGFGRIKGDISDRDRFKLWDFALTREIDISEFYQLLILMEKENYLDIRYKSDDHNCSTYAASIYGGEGLSKNAWNFSGVKKLGVLLGLHGYTPAGLSKAMKQLGAIERENVVKILRLMGQIDY